MLACEQVTMATYFPFPVTIATFFLLQAVALDMNPLYLMLPVTIATSFAFMLPVATPPNAIVFAYGNMRIVDMVRRFPSFLPASPMQTFLPYSAIHIC